MWRACTQELVECIAISTEEAVGSCAGMSGSRTVTRQVVQMVSDVAGVE
jgi:hypothetical protein